MTEAAVKFTYAPASNSTPLSGIRGSIEDTAPVKGMVNKLVPVIEVFLKTIFPAEALLVPVIPLMELLQLIFKLEYWEQEHLLELYLQEERESEE